MCRSFQKNSLYIESFSKFYYNMILDNFFKICIEVSKKNSEYLKNFFKHSSNPFPKILAQFLWNNSIRFTKISYNFIKIDSKFHYDSILIKISHLFAIITYSKLSTIFRNFSGFLQNLRYVSSKLSRKLRFFIFSWPYPELSQFSQISS